jgi:hypothetical protein
MCQTCVDNGHLAQQTHDRIEAFLEQYPDAEHGPAHIVLGDDNVEDGHIEWCLALARAALSGNKDDLPLRSRYDNETDWIALYSDCDRDALRATIVFLNELLTIPEEER